MAIRSASKTKRQNCTHVQWRDIFSHFVTFCMHIMFRADIFQESSKNSFGWYWPFTLNQDWCISSETAVLDSQWLANVSEDISLPTDANTAPDILIDSNGLFWAEITDIPYIRLCKECHSCLSKAKILPLSLANHMFLGSVPSCLRDITVVEEAMITHSCSKSCIIQLQENKDDNDNSAHISSPFNQCGFHRHIVVYLQKPSPLTDILPPSIENVTTSICVIFTGYKKPSRHWLKTKAYLLIVQCEKVCKALVQLKNNNCHYHNVTVDNDTLNLYPEDDVIPIHVKVVPPCDEDDLTSSYVPLDTELLFQPPTTVIPMLQSDIAIWNASLCTSTFPSGPCTINAPQSEPSLTQLTMSTTPLSTPPFQEKTWNSTSQIGLQAGSQNLLKHFTTDFQATTPQDSPMLCNCQGQHVITQLLHGNAVDTKK